MHTLNKRWMFIEHVPVFARPPLTNTLIDAQSGFSDLSQYPAMGRQYSVKVKIPLMQKQTLVTCIMTPISLVSGADC